MLARGFKNLNLQPKLRTINIINRFKTTITPPSYFSEHLKSSPTQVFNEPSSSIQPNVISDSSNLSNSSYSSPDILQQQSQQSIKLNTIRGICMIISILTISYFAIDNYRVRVTLESKILEQSMNHMKSLAITQNNFNQQRRKRDTQILNERRNAQKREMKMVYHISMLRKQLIDAGLKPSK